MSPNHLSQVQGGVGSAQRPWWRVAVIGLSCWGLWACDPDGKKQCAWVLEPEPKLIGTTDPSMVPVCARNRESQKEDCRMQSSLEFAEKVYGRKFRYVDLRVKSTGIPRTIATIRFCDGKGD